MNRILLPGLLVGLLLISSAEGNDRIGSLETMEKLPTIDLISTRTDGIEMVFRLPELQTERLIIEGREYLAAEIPGGSIRGGVGDPAIPTFSRLIAVPEGATVRVRTFRMDEEEWTGIDLMPVPENREMDNALVASTNPAKMSDNDIDVTVGDPAILRDLHVVNLTFHPVHYNAAEKKMNITRRMRVEIDFVGAAQHKQNEGESTIVPTSFHNLYRHLVLNYDGQSREATIAPGTVLIICPDNADLIDSLQSLVEWKNRKGAPTQLVTLTETGSSATEIKSYIQGVYDNPSSALEYVLLIGDVNYSSYVVPTWFETLSGFNGEGDHPYTMLAGDDMLPEIHIGRLSFNTLDMLSLMISKILHYESTPYMTETDWFTRGVSVGDPAYSGYSVVDAGRWLKERWLDMGYTEVDTVFDGNISNQMRIALNRGDTVYGYRGFGGMSGWSIAHASILQNSWKMPFCVTLTCLTGEFAGGTAISESFAQAGSINPLTPRGGIGAIGTATGGTHTRYNNCMYYGIWHGLTVEEQHTMGAALSRGKLEMYLNYSEGDPNIPEIWSHWNNLIGDPSVDIWTNVPASIDVAYAAETAVGANSFRVTVTESSIPREGALVCLWKGDETHVVAYTDESGTALLPVDLATAGVMSVTVSGHNIHPHMGSVAVVDTLHIGFASLLIDDDNSGGSSGDSDGSINPGEVIELEIQLENFGNELVSTVSCSLFTDDPFVTIVDNFEEFGDIAGGSSVWCLDDFDFILNNGCPDGHTIRFTLDVQSGSEEWHSLVELDVVSAHLVAQSTSVDDGTDNSRLDPGETAALTVELLNAGHREASGITAGLKSLTTRVTVGDASGSFGTIPVDGTGDNTGDAFTISADSDVYDGFLASFLLTTQFSDGVTDSVPFTLTIGERSSTDPAGPDTYGYLAFDNTDTSYPDAPVYDWIELNPSLGGDGTEIDLGDFGQYEDSTGLIDLPFTFRYYGEDYDQVSVCSNGWLSMGPTPLISYRNWTIPGSGGPKAMLAVFWDNLYRSGSSGIFYKYDSANHRWIVEWSSMIRDYGVAAVETFEAILYDPAYHPTETGDGLIVFQYHTIANRDPINGCATVGIESPDQLDGLLYTYWCDYPDGAASLSSGRAIRFVPFESGDISTGVASGVPSEPARFGLDPCRPNPFNPMTTITFRMSDAGHARVNVYDLSGRWVTGLFDGDAGPGAHSLVWDGRNSSDRPVRSGVYFVRLEAGEKTESRRVILVR